MTFLEVLKGLGSLLALAVGVTILYVIIKGCWLVLKRAVQAIGQFIRGLCHDPHQAMVEVPFLIQLVLLPFLLAWERWYKWRHPEETRRKQALFKRNQAAAQVFQRRLHQVALYREGTTITLCKIVDFEVDEHLVSFKAEPVPHVGIRQGLEPWRFSINWNDFFYDSQGWAANNQFLHWRVNFNDERIAQLKTYAATLPIDLDADDRYTKLNHFFIYGEPMQDREALEKALAGLMDYVHAQADGAWLQTLPEALKAEVHIMGMYAFPGYPESDNQVKFEDRRNDCVMWVPMHHNPWRIQFSHSNLLLWWEGKNAY